MVSAKSGKPTTRTRGSGKSRQSLPNKDLSFKNSAPQEIILIASVTAYQRDVRRTAAGIYTEANAARPSTSLASRALTPRGINIFCSSADAKLKAAVWLATAFLSASALASRQPEARFLRIIEKHLYCLE
jgi:hypothetical protein